MIRSVKLHQRYFATYRECHKHRYGRIDHLFIDVFSRAQIALKFQNKKTDSLLIFKVSVQKYQYLVPDRTKYLKSVKMNF